MSHRGGDSLVPISGAASLPLSGEHRDLLPGLVGLGGGTDGLVELILRGLQNLADDLVRRRISVDDNGSSGGLNELSVDVVLEDLSGVGGKQC